MTAKWKPSDFLFKSESVWFSIHFGCLINKSKCQKRASSVVGIQFRRPSEGQLVHYKSYICINVHVSIAIVSQRVQSISPLYGEEEREPLSRILTILKDVNRYFSSLTLLHLVNITSFDMRDCYWNSSSCVLKYVCCMRERLRRFRAGGYDK